MSKRRSLGTTVRAGALDGQKATVTTNLRGSSHYRGGPSVKSGGANATTDAESPADPYPGRNDLAEIQLSKKRLNDLSNKSLQPSFSKARQTASDKAHPRSADRQSDQPLIRHSTIGRVFYKDKIIKPKTKSSRFPSPRSQPQPFIHFIPITPTHPIRANPHSNSATSLQNSPIKILATASPRFIIFVGTKNGSIRATEYSIPWVWLKMMLLFPIKSPFMKRGSK